MPSSPLHARETSAGSCANPGMRTWTSKKKSESTSNAIGKEIQPNSLRRFCILSMPNASSTRRPAMSAIHAVGNRTNTRTAKRPATMAHKKKRAGGLETNARANAKGKRTAASKAMAFGEPIVLNKGLLANAKGRNENSWNS